MAEKQRRLALVASKGTLDWAYPPFILASTAAAMGWEVGIFFTFHGLNLLKKDMNSKIHPAGNPGFFSLAVPSGALVFVILRLYREGAGSGRVCWNRKHDPDDPVNARVRGADVEHHIPRLEIRAGALRRPGCLCG